MQEILADPTKFGAPTFEEFARNRDKWMGRDEELFELSDAGSQTDMRKFIQKHIYKFRTYKTESLEMMERIITSEGYKIQDLDMYPQMIPLGGGKWNVEVEYKPKGSKINFRD